MMITRFGNQYYHSRFKFSVYLLQLDSGINIYFEYVHAQ